MKLKRMSNINRKYPKYDVICEGKISVAQEPDHLELCVVPKKTVTPYHQTFECKINFYQHRMEFIRTVTTIINCSVSICVLLKVFKVI